MPVLIAYAVVSVANIVASAPVNTTLEWLTKPLLMPLLALWLWRAARGTGRPVGGFVAALPFSAADLAVAGARRDRPGGADDRLRAGAGHDGG